MVCRLRRAAGRGRRARGDRNLNGLHFTSPRQVALHILAGRLAANGGGPSALPLATFQSDGAARIQDILARRRIAMLADSVGLGKTYTASALIEQTCARGERVLLVVPTGLKRMWRATIQSIHATAGVVIVSHSLVGRGHLPAGDFGLVVVDEAHAFRNPRTRRYLALRAQCRAARVLLITATPVNNSLADLYFQLRLGCGDAAFRDLGIGSLKALLLGQEPRSEQLARLRAAVMVRRTRPEIAGEASLRFPSSVAMTAVRYDLPLPPAEIAEHLNRLSFVGYTLNGATAPPELLRFAFLKRIESGVAAITATLTRQIRFYEQLQSALAQQHALSPQTFRSLYHSADDCLQLVFDEVALTPFRATPELRLSVDRELHALRKLRARLRASEDAKLAALIALLRSRGRTKTIVFTEYRDTARAIWQALRQRFATGLIDGESAWLGESRAARQDVVERFAPLANAAHVHPREAIQVLVATDVLAEGMNLQDADAVVSYDLPWNPVRLIQRAGRIDRMGSSNNVVNVYNFLPDREFDAFLGLARTIRGKLANVRVAVGLERPVLEPEEQVELAMQAVAESKPELLGGLTDRRSARLRARYQPPGAVTGLPCAILPAGRPGEVLVGLRRGAESAVVAWHHTRQVADFADADELLLDALDVETGAAPNPLVVERAAAAALRFIQEQTVSSVPEKRSVTARLAERIRRELSQLALDDGPEVWAAAESVLQLLSDVSDAQTEAELAGVLVRSFKSPMALLKACLAAMRRPKSAVPLEDWRVSGVLVLN